MVDNEKLIKSWFGCFATQLDKNAELHLPLPLEADELLDLADFMNLLKQRDILERDSSCRFAYHSEEVISLYINGCLWNTQGVSQELMIIISNNRLISIKDIIPYVNNTQSQAFLHGLWQLQWLQII